MDLVTALRQGDGMASIDDLARGFGLAPAQAEAVVASIAPRLAERLERNTLSRGGLADLVAMMGELRGQQLLLGAAQIGTDHGRLLGNHILEQILVGKDASRALAARAAASSGISETLVKAMLPYIATMVLGWLTRKASGGLGDIISKISKLPEMGDASRSGGNRGGVSDGNPFPIPSSEITGGGSMLPGPMLPGPEGMTAPRANPYGDLSDAIRRGGGGGGVSAGASPLWTTVRQVLGGLLGFRSSGLVSWLIRIVVLRYGWRILSLVLGRMLRGR